MGAAQAASRALTLALLVSGCRRPEPLAEALLATSDPAEQATGRAALDAVAARVESALRARPSHPVPQVLSQVIFGELGFAREVDDGDLRFQRLASVLAGRRGSCYGLGALYLALGERLGPAHRFAVAAVLVPGHLFVRIHDPGGDHDVELLHQGEVMPAGWHRARYQVPEVRAYLRPLTSAEVLAVFDYNLGNDLRLRGRLPDAAAAYGRAAAAFPDFAEAQASLGLVRHLLGQLPAALAAYQAARAANPQLPGLDRNLALLQEELRGGH